MQLARGAGGVGLVHGWVRRRGNELSAAAKEPWCVEGPQELGLCTLEVELTPMPGDEPCTYQPAELVFTADDVARGAQE